jgi:hypothetical protein
MKIDRCASSSASRTARKYSSPSTRKANWRAWTVRQQLRPGRRIGSAVMLGAALATGA